MTSSRSARLRSRASAALRSVMSSMMVCMICRPSSRRRTAIRTSAMKGVAVEPPGEPFAALESRRDGAGDVHAERLAGRRAVGLPLGRQVEDPRSPELLDARGPIEAQRRRVAVDEALVVERAKGDRGGGPLEERAIQALGVRQGARRALARFEAALEVAMVAFRCSSPTPHQSSRGVEMGRVSVPRLRGAVENRTVRRRKASGSRTSRVRCCERAPANAHDCARGASVAQALFAMGPRRRSADRRVDSRLLVGNMIRKEAYDVVTARTARGAEKASRASGSHRDERASASRAASRACEPPDERCTRMTPILLVTTRAHTAGRAGVRLLTSQSWPSYSASASRPRYSATRSSRRSRRLSQDLDAAPRARGQGALRAGRRRRDRRSRLRAHSRHRRAQHGPGRLRRGQRLAASVQRDRRRDIERSSWTSSAPRSSRSTSCRGGRDFDVRLVHLLSSTVDSPRLARSRGPSVTRSASGRRS